jgi:hypothetical protein
MQPPRCGLGDPKNPQPDTNLGASSTRPLFFALRIKVGISASYQDIALAMSPVLQNQTPLQGLSRLLASRDVATSIAVAQPPIAYWQP